ncbi:hypothetical protein [Pseudarcicella hirudinis]|uniref:hypothetical protein n=1 Tax=Pseudarcicella hirudinis TaxID=1079859 RepID=UPI001160DC05|nr:hypothetical protein [Pseudarcicella hirudinis]
MTSGIQLTAIFQKTVLLITRNDFKRIHYIKTLFETLFLRKLPVLSRIGNGVSSNTVFVILMV